MNNNINWKEACLSKSDTIRDAIGNLNKTSLRIVIIVNKTKRIVSFLFNIFKYVIFNTFSNFK